MPTPQERVAAAMQFFFQTALPQATGKTFAQLSNPRVHVGAYARYAGAPIATSVGQPITPVFALRMSPPLPVAGGVPNAAGAAVPAAGPLWPILWVRQAADAGVDDEAEIRRVMADIDSFSQLFDATGAAAAGTPGGAPATPGAAPATPAAAPGTAGPAPATPGGGPSSGGTPGVTPGVGGSTSPSGSAPSAADWARAIVANRAALTVNLSTLTAVPAGMASVTTDVEELTQVLRHFCTYAADGAYYRRWTGAGRDPENAQHLTPEYKQNNVTEIRLERNRLYLYGVVPEALLTGGGDIGAGAFREIVLRFTDTGSGGSFGVSTVHTARWRRNAAPHEDFVFFYAEEGDGMQLLPEVRAKLSPNLVAFVGELFGAGPRRDDVLNTSPLVIHGDQNQSRVILLADVDGPIQLPPQVITMDLDGPARTLSVPADGAVIAAIAQQPAVKHLGVVPPARASNDVARTVVNYAGLNAKIPAAKQGGANVVVGVIDTGIDGGHQAVAGRVHSYWDQATVAAAVVLHGNSPAQNHPGNTAYAAFNFGVELTGPATVNAQDPGGHGTHVAATCAGREVLDGAGHVAVPAGMAPNALIVAVRAIEVGTSNYLLGIRYIFQKATELGLPCVINMSFGQHRNPHDGTNALARELLRTVQNAAGAYLPGRILVAAAGNERNKQYHLRRQLPPRGTRAVGEAALQLPIQLRPTGRESEAVNIWVRNPTGGAPTAFPLRVWVFRRSSSHGRNTPVSTTRFVALGEDTMSTPTGAGTFTSHRVRVDIVSSLSDSLNGDFSIQVLLSTTDPPLQRGMMDGQWVVALDNGSTSSLDVHAWMADTARSTFIGAVGEDDDAFLVGLPANAPGVISVASVNSRLSWTNTLGSFLSPNESNANDLSSFSSPGPLRTPSVALTTVYPTVHHEINGVDVSAPGCRIQSALSRQISRAPDPVDQLSPVSWLLQGTSMASPVVTGVIANILADSPTPAAAPTLPQVLDLLKNASSIPAASAFQPPPVTPAPARPYSQDWGYGLLDAARLKP